MPPLKQGETYPLTEETVPLTERMTSPPSHLSEAELITLMERHGIGTDASIATHINNICERNYVQIAAGKSAEERVSESQRVRKRARVCIREIGRSTWDMGGREHMGREASGADRRVDAVGGDWCQRSSGQCWCRGTTG